MANGNGTSNQDSPLNLTAFIGLIATFLAVCFYPGQITSHRPAEASDIPNNNKIKKAILARLWEDPLKWKPEESQASGSKAVGFLRSQIASRCVTNKPTLLMVMVQGGNYGEDKESRIRSRYAVGSALGQAGYVPENPLSIGGVMLPWRNDLKEGGWLTNDESSIFKKNRTTQFPFEMAAERGMLLSFASQETARQCECCSNQEDSAAPRLPLSFEWYKKNIFQKEFKPETPEYILVLWLDEQQFEDCPSVQLGILLDNLGGDGSISNFDRICLVGPRSSSTLRNLFPDYLSGTNFNIGHNLIEETSNILHKVDVYCATPGVMDELLVKNQDLAPRKIVTREMKKYWFKSFKNLSVTDAQLARETFDELRLRNVDLSRPDKNLVLISEWDTFHGSVLSLTYGAELAMRRQTTFRGNFDEFIADFREGGSLPSNMKNYYYLRGLDGATEQSTQSNPEKAPENSFDALRKKASEENKAFGGAQYDYLSRMVTRIKEQEKDLKLQGHGQIDAIGILGSDVYDILVILEALRPKFPNALFFTSDLDARFYHPEEMSWSRNLIVLSGYGLELGRKFQDGVPPFRDSVQTAQYAATLAALGEIKEYIEFLPRRFEIGRGVACDLSVTSGEPLHPAPPAFRDGPWKAKDFLLAALVLGLGGLLATIAWRPLRRLTWDSSQCQIEVLWLHRDDIGTKQLGLKLLELMRCKSEDVKIDSLAKYLLGSLQGFYSTEDFSKWNDDEATEFLLNFFNQRILQNSISDEVVKNSDLVTPETKHFFQQVSREKQGERTFLLANSCRRLKANRMVLHDFLKNLPEDKDCTSLVSDSERESFKAAGIAREAGFYNYQCRRRLQILVWVWTIGTVIIFGSFFGVVYVDAFRNPKGEPLSFSSGLSIWPADFLKLIALVLSVLFMVFVQYFMKERVCQLVRNFRLPLRDFKYKGPLEFTLSSVPVPEATVEVPDLWILFQQRSLFSRRFVRTLLSFGIYLLFACSIFWFTGLPYRPVRGNLASFLDLTISWVSGLAFLFLTFWVMDTVCLCRWFIEQISEAPSQYGKDCERNFEEKTGLTANSNMIADWIDFQLIVNLTETVNKFVYYPFVVLFLLIVSRNHFWANWPFQAGIVIAFGVNILLVVGNLLILQRAAERARLKAEDRLEQKIAITGKQTTKTPEEYQQSAAQKLLEGIRTAKRGAFVPFWQKPLVRAILVPSGGAALLQLISNYLH